MRAAQPAPTWRLPLGPAITVIEGEAERVGDLVLAVRSVEQALRAWQAADPAVKQLPLRFPASSWPSG